MISRRQVLSGAAAAAVAALARRGTPLLAKASQPTTPVNFTVPTGACDCHTHVFGDPQRFPFAAGRTYTPESASVAELRALHQALRMDRMVIVQPSVYGTDNACTLEAIRQLGSRARGVAVIDDATPDSALDNMHQAGVRGIRLNLATAGQTDPAAARRRLQAAIARVAPRRWHIQMNTQLVVIEAIQDAVSAASIPVVFDHFGGAQAALGVGQPGFGALVKLVQAGHAYVKVSAPYRSSNQGPAYADVAPLAKALIGANPQRIVWGSDWPHPGPPADRPLTDITPFYEVDDGLVLNQLAIWAPDPATRKTILVDNPARIYGF
jgi:predicted TIM-barrel fold metal-dependent hydrolase